MPKALDCLNLALGKAAGHNQKPGKAGQHSSEICYCNSLVLGSPGECH